jgi:glutamyl-tRNA reductase
VSIVVIGLNHRTVPLELLERMIVSEERLPKALHDLTSRPNIGEAVVLSTCNRTEIYAVAERFHGAYEDVRDFLSDLAHLPAEAFADHLYSFYDDVTARHLFAVAAGIDSAVLGESEILGQVRVAWERAQAEGTARAGLNLLFRHALEVGKRARTETSIARHTTSVSQAAVMMARERLGSFEGRRVLLIGAGDMAAGMADALAHGGTAQVAVTNRTLDRAVAVASRINARAVSLAEVPELLAEVDLVLSSTGSVQPLVTRDDVDTAFARRRGRPLLCIDMAVPRDIDPGVGSIEGATLLDIDDLRAFAARGVVGRQREVAEVREIIDEEVSRYADAAHARTMSPLLGELHARAEEIRAAEVQRHSAKLRNVGDRERAAIDALTKGIVAKLLHEPTVRLKDVAGTPRGERLAEALRDLFDLEP